MAHPVAADRPASGPGVADSRGAQRTVVGMTALAGEVAKDRLARESRSRQGPSGRRRKAAVLLRHARQTDILTQAADLRQSIQRAPPPLAVAAGVGEDRKRGA